MVLIFLIALEFALLQESQPQPEGNVTIAEIKTESTIARAFVDECIWELTTKKLTAEKAAMAKYWVSDLQCKTIDKCLQLHGGYGYMNEYNVARAWRDARVGRIYGGTNEIMKEIIGRSLGF